MVARAVMGEAVTLKHLTGREFDPSTTHQQGEKMKLAIGDTVYNMQMGLGIVKSFGLSIDPLTRFLEVDFPYMDTITIHETQVARVDMKAFKKVQQP